MEAAVPLTVLSDAEFLLFAGACNFLHSPTEARARDLAAQIRAHPRTMEHARLVADLLHFTLADARDIGAFMDVWLRTNYFILVDCVCLTLAWRYLAEFHPPKARGGDRRIDTTAYLWRTHGILWKHYRHFEDLPMLHGVLVAARKGHASNGAAYGLFEVDAGNAMAWDSAELQARTRELEPKSKRARPRALVAEGSLPQEPKTKRPRISE